MSSFSFFSLHIQYPRLNSILFTSHRTFRCLLLLRIFDIATAQRKHTNEVAFRKLADLIDCQCSELGEAPSTPWILHAYKMFMGYTMRTLQGFLYEASRVGTFDCVSSPHIAEISKMYSLGMDTSNMHINKETLCRFREKISDLSKLEGLVESLSLESDSVGLLNASEQIDMIVEKNNVIAADLYMYRWV